ncbi:DUF1961 family protein [Alteromonas sp. 1_MG-2023]|uniref:DUF1961 family protein n=1 Tax=Alteromonas sp. 1_MG-2023 TaxID=3062669 RepID=UPI0026E21CCF|nr:DUF1961 family protein [Alteromonas sp. 1_MG-2023]MDO6473841.1 DUF1961 family protein [Alteromonas sp. 1_MG-2023]
MVSVRTYFAAGALFLMVCGCSGNALPGMTARAQVVEEKWTKGDIIYQNPLSREVDMAGWRMEGPGQTAFQNGWMQMWSPDEAGHHVFWMPETLPDSFIAEWDAQALKTDAGLVIVFFAAKGVRDEDIFDASLAPRDGTFTQYTNGDIRSYHISYYANAAHNPARGHANLRKNNTFSLLQQGEPGIAATDTRINHIRLVKHKNHIQLSINGRTVIDYTDDMPVVDGIDTGPPLQDGKLGFRQMQWTKFQYRDLKIWALKGAGHGE